ncbi:MAG: hypothetical protein M3444_01200, partial [Acidobacteriota bacterium]|nr:hypothetical protein [Acidobacteriota bacterium]
AAQTLAAATRVKRTRLKKAAEIFLSIVFNSSPSEFFKFQAQDLVRMSAPNRASVEKIAVGY